MTGPSNPFNSAEDLQFHSDTIADTVVILNAFGAYLSAEVDSEEEKEWDIAVAELMHSTVQGDRVGHILLTMANMIHLFADGDQIQAWLEEQRTHMYERAKELGLTIDDDE